MPKVYRSYQPEQDFLLPPSPREWLPEDHLAYFVSRCGGSVGSDSDARGVWGGATGTAAYDPRMMISCWFMVTA